MTEQARPPKKRGPKPRLLSDDERKELLRLLSSGFGVNMALEEMKVSWYFFRQTKKKDRGFCHEVARAIEHCDEKLVAIRTAQAMGGDGRALDMLIARRDAARRFEQQRRDARKAAERTSGMPGGAFRVRIEYDDPDGRLHRPDDPPAPQAAPGPEGDP